MTQVISYAFYIIGVLYIRFVIPKIVLCNYGTFRPRKRLFRHLQDSLHWATLHNTCWAKLNKIAVEINRPRGKMLKKSFCVTVQ